MIIAMLLAHLLGDFVLQWDRLAAWKSRAVKGALVHGLVVTLVTWLIAMVVDPGWWPWVLFIGVTHTAIDSLQPLVLPRLPRAWVTRTALPRFLLDQSAHLLLLVYALAASGYLDLGAPAAQLQAGLQQDRLLAYLLGYVFLSMPAWVLVEFLVYGLLKGAPPDFAHGPNKYVGTLERGLMATFVVLGQFVLVPLAALPRVLVEGRRVRDNRRLVVYVAELLTSTLLAIGTGLALRGL